MEARVTLVPIKFSELYDYIRIAFAGDAELHKYHICPGTYGKMITHTFDRIAEQARDLHLECAAVTKGDVPIGFTVTTREPSPMLYSFGIKHAERSREVVTGWLIAVAEQLGDIFTVPLNNQNTRALNFFKRNGFVPHFQDDQITILCQSQQQ